MSVQVDRRHSEDSQISLILLGCIPTHTANRIMGLHSKGTADLKMGPYSITHCRCYYGTRFQHTLQVLLWYYIPTHTAGVIMGLDSNTLQVLLWDYIPTHTAGVIMGLHSNARFDLQML